MSATRDSELADEAGQDLPASRELRRGRRIGDHVQQESTGVRSRDSILSSRGEGSERTSQACSASDESRQLTTLELTCASNMPPPGREVQAEWHGSYAAYRVRSNSGLECAP